MEPSFTAEKVLHHWSQVVEASVPANQETNFFKLGGSLLVGDPITSSSLIQPDVGVYPAGNLGHTRISIRLFF